MDTNIQSAMTALQTQAITSPVTTGANCKVIPKNMAAIDKAANEFESVFVSQFMSTMFSGVQTNGITGGGQGEEMFRSLMIDQYAAGFQKQGGFGLAASVKAEMIKMQGGSA